MTCAFTADARPQCHPAHRTPHPRCTLLVQAEAHGIVLIHPGDPAAPHIGRAPFRLSALMSRGEREANLVCMGYARGSPKWEQFTEHTMVWMKVAHGQWVRTERWSKGLCVCACHYRPEDIVQGRKRGTFTVRAGARPMTAAALRAAAPPSRALPQRRGSGATPLAVHLMDKVDEMVEAVVSSNVEAARQAGELVLERCRRQALEDVVAHQEAELAHLAVTHDRALREIDAWGDCVRDVQAALADAEEEVQRLRKESAAHAQADAAAAARSASLLAEAEAAAAAAGRLAPGALKKLMRHARQEKATNGAPPMVWADIRRMCIESGAESEWRRLASLARVPESGEEVAVVSKPARCNQLRIISTWCVSRTLHGLTSTATHVRQDTLPPTRTHARTHSHVTRPHPVPGT